MRMAALLAVVLAVSPASATTSSSGLRGVVKRGPISPVCRAEEPCSEPARHVTLLFSRNGRVLGRSTTDAVGRYRIGLPAGSYRVSRPVSPRVGRGLEPDQVRVQAGRFSRVDFMIDTGIR
jgi:hypothetical protein